LKILFYPLLVKSEMPGKDDEQGGKRLLVIARGELASGSSDYAPLRFLGRNFGASQSAKKGLHDATQSAGEHPDITLIP
jgi:hypothetical protein